MNRIVTFRKQGAVAFQVQLNGTRILSDWIPVKNERDVADKRNAFMLAAVAELNQEVHNGRNA